MSDGRWMSVFEGDAGQACLPVCLPAQAGTGGPDG